MEVPVCAAETRGVVNAEEISVQAESGADEGMSEKTVPQFALTTKDGKVPTFQYGERKKLTLVFTNRSGADLHHIKISPKMDTETSKWPFVIEKQDYNTEVELLEAGKSVQVEYSFTEREDVKSASYRLVFTVSADELAKSQESGVYVKTTAKAEEGKTEDKNETAADESSGGSVENGAISGGEETSSVPRVIVTGFSTEPEEVKAGSDFKLIVHLKNTSKTKTVRNMLFDFNAAAEGDETTAASAFLPSSGSSTVYLDTIRAGGQKDISIELNAKADLTQKPYSIEMTMKYEDTSGNQYDGSSSLSIPVKQDARFEFSEFELSSDSIEVGNEVNVMCNLYNLGRTKLYNVKVRFEGEGISGGEVFVGNVESGATASIDSMLTGESATTGDGAVKMVMTYEDEAGEETTFEKELTIFVTEEIETEDMLQSELMEDEQGGFSLGKLIAGFLAAVAVAAVVVLLILKRKKKKIRAEEDELTDELDRFVEDEQ